MASREPGRLCTPPSRSRRMTPPPESYRRRRHCHRRRAGGGGSTTTHAVPRRRRRRQTGALRTPHTARPAPPSMRRRRTQISPLPAYPPSCRRRRHRQARSGRCGSGETAGGYGGKGAVVQTMVLRSVGRGDGADGVRTPAERKSCDCGGDSLRRNAWGRGDGAGIRGVEQRACCWGSLAWRTGSEMR